jgi:hypothetical protein
MFSRATAIKVTNEGIKLHVCRSKGSNIRSVRTSPHRCDFPSHHGQRYIRIFPFCQAEGWPDSDKNLTNNRLHSERRHWRIVLIERKFTTLQEFSITTHKPQEQIYKHVGIYLQGLSVLTGNYILPFYVLEMVIISTY